VRARHAGQQIPHQSNRFSERNAYVNLIRPPQNIWINATKGGAFFRAIAAQEIFHYDTRSGPTTREKSFKQEARALDGREAMTEYEAQARATREKTARLKSLRLAKEAQAQAKAEAKAGAVPKDLHARNCSVRSTSLPFR
jgi:hypothetical protein